jgi:Ras family protein
MPGDLLKRRKIVVLGSRSVGKSSLIVQFIENHFLEPYYPTIEEIHTKLIPHQGVEYECDIIDTAGQDEYSIISSKYTVGIHGYILVYSVTNRASFEMVKIVYDKLTSYSGAAKLPCVVVGSKADLGEGASRQVTAEEAKEMAKEMGSAAWIETSARKGTNIAKVFELCLAEIENFLHPPQPNQKGGCIVM